MSAAAPADSASHSMAALVRVVAISVASSVAFVRDNCFSVFSASSRTVHALNRPEVRLILRKRWSDQRDLLLQVLAWTGRTFASNMRRSVKKTSARWQAAARAALLDAAFNLMGTNAPLPAVEFDDHGFFDEFNDMLEPRTVRKARSGKVVESSEDFELLPTFSEDPTFYTGVPVEKKRFTPAATSSKAVAEPANPMCLETYLCGCGECPQYDAIAEDVDEYATWLDNTEKRRATRLLQALSTYNEDIEYSREMVVAANECLQVWQGDENKAFESMTVLFDELPRMCANSA